MQTVAPCTKIGYLPVIDASPTQLSTINTVLTTTLEIAGKLQLDDIVIVGDQAVYAKVQQVRWQNNTFTKRVVVRLGEFHTLMSYMAVIGRRFGDAGLQDLFVEADLVAEGSVQAVLNGHNYNRSIRAHKLTTEAMRRLQISEFLDHLPQQECSLHTSTVQTLLDSYPNTFTDLVESSNAQKLMQSFKQHIENRCQESITYWFWNSYLKMVQSMLLFIRATRQGMWDVHLSTVKEMIPWFFAYGRINYSKYLSIYLEEMSILHQTNPIVHQKFLEGEFVVQQQESHGFSGTPCDQVIEQTFNRDSKTKGGLVGITLNKGAVNRWVLSHPARCGIANACLLQAGKSSTCSTTKETSQSRIDKDEKDVQGVISVLTCYGSPFMADNHEKLVHLCSGVVANTEVKENLLNAEKEGIIAYKKFRCERLQSGSLDFYAPATTRKFKTFGNVAPKPKTNAVLKNITLKENRDLLARFLMLAQVKKLDMKEVLCYSLNAYPSSLFNDDGSMVKTNKASLMHHLKNADCCSNTSRNLSGPTAVILDAMAILHQQTRPSETFGELAANVFNQVVAIAASFQAYRVDFVIDRYAKLSIKAEERSRRARHSGACAMHVTRSNQKVPRRYKNFLSNDENKQSLIDFMFQCWRSYSTERFRNILVYFCKGEDCYVLPSAAVINAVANLQCDHEEADTRMFLHATHAAQHCDNVVLHSPDTDVLVIAIGCAHNVDARLYICHSNEIISVSEIVQCFGQPASAAMIGLHAFSGCDSVSAFRGKGKKRMLTLLEKSDLYASAFSRLGSTWNVPQESAKLIEKLTCELYGQKNISDLNELRYRLFKVGQYSQASLPPNKDSFMLHLKRANYQAAIWRKCLQRHIQSPPPEEHGWLVEMSGQQKLVVRYSTLPIAPASLLEFISCKCKKLNCESKKCSCRHSGLPCTSLCLCVTCNNANVAK